MDNAKHRPGPGAGADSPPAAETPADQEPVDIDRFLAERRQIAVVWSIEDVQDVRPDLSDEFFSQLMLVSTNYQLRRIA